MVARFKKSVRCGESRQWFENKKVEDNFLLLAIRVGANPTRPLFSLMCNKPNMKVAGKTATSVHITVPRLQNELNYISKLAVSSFLTLEVPLIYMPDI